MPDKYKALWISYSSMSDYLKCPRAYYLKNVYKNPETNKKIEITKPALSLGSAVHKVIEPLAKLKPEDRFTSDLSEKFSEVFSTYEGKRGGFVAKSDFDYFKKQGLGMISTVIQNNEPLIKQTYVAEQDLLHGWLSKTDEVIICGKIDWINQLEDDKLEVIDFKTSKREEEDSLQLQIYTLLLFLLNKQQVNSLNYWYLRLNKDLTPVDLPDVRESKKIVLDIALEMKEARENSNFICPKSGCFHCEEYEQIISGNAEMVGVGEFNREIYFVN